MQPKYLINSDNFKPGFVDPDDHWENRLRLPGQNTLLGWQGADGQIRTGNGAKTLGQELANSDAFAQCQVEKVFRTVCFRSPSDDDRPFEGHEHRGEFQERRRQPEARVRRDRRATARAIEETVSHEARL